jgi:endonuclease/exonuclease/phosphatase family metal-dependent hydrolase
MKILTWNVQWCRGLDGRVDPARIIRTAREMASFDVLCLQEIAVNFPGLGGSRGEDQVEALRALLPGYHAHYGAATDIDDGNGARSLFGNLILSRQPVLQVYRHLLPWPADPQAASMQRIAVEAVIRAPWGSIRVVTTHLEYYSRVQREAQVEGLRRLHAQACAEAASGRLPGEPGGPFAVPPRPSAAIVTGDFNFNPRDPAHARMTALFEDNVPRLFDAWPIAHPDAPHAPTVGIHENSFSPGPDCFDFFFLTPDLASRVEAVEVDTRTRASDHQPVLLELRD